MGVKKGIVALCFGVFFLTMSIIIIFAAIPYSLDIIIAFVVELICLWTLTFFIPGILCIKGFKMSDKWKYWYSVAPLTLLCMLVYMLIILIIAGENFWTGFINLFGAGLGLSLLFSLIVICGAHEFY